MIGAKIEIIAELLVYCKQPKRKSRITTRLGHNDTFNNSYVDICTAQELLDFTQDESYVTTEKGQHFLRTYALVNRL